MRSCHSLILLWLACSLSQAVEIEYPCADNCIEPVSSCEVVAYGVHAVCDLEERWTPFETQCTPDNTGQTFTQTIDYGRGQYCYLHTYEQCADGTRNDVVLDAVGSIVPVLIPGAPESLVVQKTSEALNMLVDSNSNVGEFNGSIATTIDLNASGNDRLVVVHTGMEFTGVTGDVPTNVTINGTSIISNLIAASIAATFRAEWSYFALESDLPAGAGTYDVVVTFSGGVHTNKEVEAIAVQYFEGIDQAGLVTSGTGFSSGKVGSGSASVTPTSSDYLIVAGMLTGGTAAHTWNSPAGVVKSEEIFNAEGGISSAYIFATASGAQTIGWTVSPTVRYGMTAGIFDVASGGGGTDVTSDIDENLENFSLISNITVGDPVTSSISENLEDFTPAISIDLIITSAISETLDNFSLSSSVIVGDPVTSNISETLEDFSLSSTMSVGTDITSSVDENLDDFSLSSNIDLEIISNIDEALEDFSVSSNIDLEILSDIDEMLENFSLSSGVILSINSSISENLEDFSISSEIFIGDVVNSNINETLEDFSSTISIDLILNSNIDQTLEDFSLSSNVVVGNPVISDIDEMLEDFSVSSSIFVGDIVTSNINETLEDFSLSSSMVQEITSSVNEALDNFVLDSTIFIGANVTSEISETLENFSIISGLVAENILAISEMLEDFTITSNINAEIISSISQTLQNFSLISGIDLEIISNIDETLEDFGLNQNLQSFNEGFTLAFDLSNINYLTFSVANNITLSSASE